MGLASLAPFTPGLFGDFLGWDDDKNFLDQPLYRGFERRHLVWMLTTFHMGHYHPLTWLTHAIDYAIWGMNPFGYHLTSLIVHASTAVAFFFLAVSLLREAIGNRLHPSALTVGAGAAALFFSVHPLRAEPVVWLSTRGDVLSGFFFVATLLAYLKAIGAGARTEASSSVGFSRGWYGVALVLFLGALLAKAIVVSLPLVLLILDVYPLSRLGGAGRRVGISSRRVFAEKLPFLLMSVAAAAVALMARVPFGAARTLGEYDLVSRVTISVYGAAFYLWKTALPIGLSPLYEVPRHLVLLSPPIIMSVITVVGLGCALVLTRRRWHALTAASAAYLVILLPTIGIVHSGPQIAADRYTYLAGLPLALLAGAGVAWCADQWLRQSTRKGWGQIGLTIATLLVVVMVGVTARQSLVWIDSVSLWTHAIDLNPSSAHARTGLAGAFLEHGRLQEADLELERALKLNPWLPPAVIGRAVTLSLGGRNQEALEFAQKGVRLRPLDPDMYRVLGNILRTEKRFEQALAAFRESARLAPTASGHLYGVALTLADLGRHGEAVAALEQARRLATRVDPGSPEDARFVALVFSRSDPERARAAWVKYLARLGTLKNPSAVQQSRMREALNALEKLEGQLRATR